MGAIQGIGVVRCVIVRSGLEINWEELGGNNMRGYGENGESENPVIETLQKSIWRDEVQKFAYLIWKKSKERMERIGVDKLMLGFVKHV